MADFVKLHPSDNVAVAVKNIPEGYDYAGVLSREEISQGHKMALSDIKAGENVIKYGTAIGHATEDITAGAWVHTHNMRTNLEGELEYTYNPVSCELEKKAPRTFMGYRREDGRAAIRNEIWIVPTVGCVNDIAKAMAKQNADLVSGTLDGIYAFPHPYGCSQTGADHATTRKLLASLVKHPNAAAVLVLGLGCENLTREQFIEELGEFDRERIKFLVCQEVEDELAEGRKILEECANYARTFKREEIPASELIIGMKCGGSDGLSSITANPTVGKLSDILISEGGSTILTEVPEMFGAEGMLMHRCESREVFDRAVNMINSFKDYYLSHGEVVYENPSPGNKKGGITTLEDKSCGCVKKGGTAPIVDILNYAERVRKPGLTLLSGPGNDLVSATALTAAGAHMVLFTTGRGTPFGAPAPTLKISTNTPLATKKHGWIDFNAGTVAEGESIDDAAERLYSLVLEVASGKLSTSERMGYREIAIFKNGVTL